MSIIVLPQGDSLIGSCKAWFTMGEHIYHETFVRLLAQGRGFLPPLSIFLPSRVAISLSAGTHHPLTAWLLSLEEKSDDVCLIFILGRKFEPSV